MKILWAAPYFVRNSIDGGATSVLNLLQGLVAKGHEVLMIGLTLVEEESTLNGIYTQNFNGLNIISISPASRDKIGMNNVEINKWLGLYMDAVDIFKPDIILSLGGECLDMHVYGYARYKNIKNAAFLINTTYEGKYWCRDVDYFLTDSIETATHYKNKINIDCHPVGVFIDANRFNLDLGKERKYITFINTLPSKGSIIVAQLVSLMNSKRPDILFRIITSRGDTLGSFKSAGINDLKSLKNLEIIDKYEDLRDAFFQTKLLIAPSLAKESYGMVVTEAKINGIPSIVTNRGGLPEALGNGGDIINLPDEFYCEPYNKILDDNHLEKISNLIIKYFDDEEFYRAKVTSCIAESSLLRPESRIDFFEKKLNQFLM